MGEGGSGGLIQEKSVFKRAGTRMDPEVCEKYERKMPQSRLLEGEKGRIQRFQEQRRP